MSVASSPGFGKTLFTRTVHNILNERSVENVDTASIVRLLSPILNTENYAKTCDHGYIFSHYAPVFDEREIGICLGGGCGHRAMIPLLGSIASRGLAWK
jgi:hypothetical protein